jgi:hypothetical protein
MSDRNTRLKYEYSYVDTEGREIRLFELAPAARHSDPVVGSMRRTRLTKSTNRRDKNPDFDALSYVWGPQTPAKYIIVDGRRLHVGRNLKRALQDIRGDDDEPLLIWVDAICIDQEDRTERASQVQLMRYIYESAKTVRVWIDEKIDPNSAPFRIMRELDVKSFSIEDRVRAALGEHSWEFWQPVAKLFLNEYWSRLWIQQELFLAHGRVFYFRDFVLFDFVVFIFESQIRNNVLHPFEEANKATPVQRTATDIVNKIYHGRQFYGFFGDSLRGIHFTAANWLLNMDNKSWNGTYNCGWLLDFYLSSQQLKMSDKRDRVYGVLGLATDYNAQDFDVSYSRSEVKTHSLVFANHINKHDNLYFLTLTGRRTLPRECPSWFPQWLVPKPHKIPENYYHAAGETTAEGSRVRRRGRHLHVKGFRIDGLAWASGNLGKMTLAAAVQNLVNMACLHDQEELDVKHLGILYRVLYPPFTNDCHHIVCSEDRPSGKNYRSVWSFLLALKSSRNLTLRQL